MGKQFKLSTKTISSFFTSFPLFETGEDSAAELHGKTREWRNCNESMRQKTWKITKEEIIGYA